MSYQPFLEASIVEQRRRIRRLYETGEMTPEVATATLLRLDIDAIARARGLAAGVQPPAAIAATANDGSLLAGLSLIAQLP